MTALSVGSREQIADFILGTDMPASPAGLYLTVSTADPLPNASGIAEPVGVVRQPITLTAPHTNNTDGVSTTNVDPIQINNITGNVTHVAIMDALSGGNMLYFGELEVIRNVSTGDSISFASGVIKLSLTEMFTGYLGTQFIEWMRGGVVDPAPAIVDLALSTTAINRDGTNFTRPITSAGYTDEAVTLAKGVHDVNDGLPIFNNHDVIFGPATTAAWASATHAAIIRNDTKEVLLYGVTSNPVSTAIGDGPGVVSGAFAVKVR